MNTAILVGLIEGLIAETLLICLLLFSLVRLRKRHNYVKAELMTLKSQVKVGSTLDANTDGLVGTNNSSNSETCTQYLKDQMALAKKRYKSQVLSGAIELNPEHNRQINGTALRYLYLRAELEAHPLIKVPHSHWHKIDKQLSPIVSKLYPFSPGAEQIEHKENQISLLRERLNHLKPYEKECSALKDKLQDAEEKIRHLQQQPTVAKAIV